MSTTQPQNRKLILHNKKNKTTSIFHSSQKSVKFFPANLALCLSFALMQPQIALANIDIPVGQDSIAKAKVISVDFKKRLAIVEVSSVRTIEGGELFFNTNNKQSIEIHATTALQFQNNLDRWISLREVQPGQPITLTVRQESNSAKSWICRNLLIQLPDPTKPNQAIPYPQNLLPIDSDKVTAEVLKVPMIFPVAGKISWNDTFLASRSGGRRHRGQDIFGKKLTPLVACFDGKVIVEINQGNAGNVVTIIGDNGYTAQYYHLNNDSPNTDDGKGTADYAFAPGLKTGDRVLAGQLVGWLGDSGNAEGTAPHLHFELWHQDTKACYNATQSLFNATRFEEPLTFLPYPDMLAGKDMVRLDGYVKGLDKDRNVMILDIIAQQKEENPPSSIQEPTRRYIKCSDNPKFAVLDSSESLKMANLSLGQRVTLFVEDAAPGQAHVLARAWVQSPPNTPVDQKSNTQATKTPSSDNSTKNSIVIRTDGNTPTGGQNAITSDHQTDALLKELNSYRVNKNLPLITANKTLSQTALQFSIRMMDGDFFDVFDSQSRMSAGDGAKRAGYKARVRALISSKDSVAGVAKEMIASYPDILNDKAIKYVGLGFAYLDYDPGKVNVKNYWTILFGE